MALAVSSLAEASNPLPTMIREAFMRPFFLSLTLAVVALAGCDRGAPGRADGGQTVAAASLSGLSAGPAAENQDSTPLVVRRVWYTNTSDIWSGPSADGRLLPVTDWSGEGSGGAVAVHDLLTGETQRVTPEANPFPKGYAENSVISPDGNRVAYVWWSDENGWELRLMEVGGSEPRVLYSDERLHVKPRQWSKDSESVLVVAVDNRNNTLGLVSVEDGSLRVLKALGNQAPVGAVLSPDGRFVIYDHRAGDDPQRDISIINLDTGEERTLVEHPAEDLVFGWAPEGGHVLFASDRTGTMGAWLLPVRAGESAGEPLLVKPELWRADPLDFDGNGSFYYVVWMHMSDVFVSTVDPETGELLNEPTRVSRKYLGSNGSPEWSPDGSQLVYLSERKRWREFGSEVIVIRSVETGEEKELQPALASYMHPRWSPDGETLLVRARDLIGRGFFGIDVQTGEVEPLLRFPEGSGNIASRAEWIENGRALLYWWPDAPIVPEYAPHPGRPRHMLRIRNLETGADEIIYEGEVSPRFAVSPDRQKVAFSGIREGRGELMVMPVGGGEPTVVVVSGESDGIGQNPAEVQWSPDGRFLYFLDFRGNNLLRVPEGGGEPEPLDWFADLRARPWFRFQPGGSRVALMCVEGDGGGEVWVMEDFLPDSQDAGEERRQP